MPADSYLALSAVWPTALTYLRLEFGTWHLTEGAEWDWPFVCVSGTVVYTTIPLT